MRQRWERAARTQVALPASKPGACNSILSANSAGRTSTTCRNSNLALESESQSEKPYGTNSAAALFCSTGQHLHKLQLYQFKLGFCRQTKPTFKCSYSGLDVGHIHKEIEDIGKLISNQRAQAKLHPFSSSSKVGRWMLKMIYITGILQESIMMSEPPVRDVSSHSLHDPCTGGGAVLYRVSACWRAVLQCRHGYQVPGKQSAKTYVSQLGRVLYLHQWNC